MDWENHLEKKPIQKIEKTVKNQSEIAACKQKTTSEKANFCSNTVFSLYFKFRAKKFHAAKPLTFSFHFLFRLDQNHYSNLSSKIMKMCEKILKNKKNIAEKEFRKRFEVEIHLNAIQLLVKQNVPSLIFDYLETKSIQQSWNKVKQ